jgi:hypothetical protein
MLDLDTLDFDEHFSANVAAVRVHHLLVVVVVLQVHVAIVQNLFPEKCTG